MTTSLDLVYTPDLVLFKFKLSKNLSTYATTLSLTLLLKFLVSNNIAKELLLISSFNFVLKAAWLTDISRSNYLPSIVCSD